MDQLKGENAQRLDEFEKDEWYSLGKSLKPEMTREEFEVMWDEFCRLKRLKAAH